MKICSKCRVNKPLDAFGRNRTKRDGRQEQCKVCANQRQKAYYQRNIEQKRTEAREYQRRFREANPDYYREKYWKDPATRRRYHLKQAYGMTPDEFKNLLEEQNGVCGICKRSIETLCVDHSHETGAVRGLLCHKCNTALGSFNDDIQTLKHAISYLSAP